MNKKIILVAIILLAIVTRMIALDHLPIELFGDELDAGYQAYSILKTGKDYLGHPWPTYFNSFSEYRAPLFIYSLVPTIAVFGLNEWGVRMAPALWGVGSILLLYLLVRRIKDEQTALLSAFVLTITPWHLQYSRAGFEVTMMLALILLGTLFWITSTALPVLFPFAILILMITPLVYSAATPFVPLLLIALWFIYKPEQLTRKMKIASLIIFFAGALFLASKWAHGQLSSRLSAAGFSASPAVLDEISAKRTADNNSLTSKLFHNKYSIYTRDMVNNYFQSFSPELLATDGDPNPAHSATGGGFGELFHIEYILFLAGLIFWILNFRKDKYSRLMVIWLFTSPVAAAVSEGGGHHATRLFLMLVPIAAATATGIISLKNNIKSPKLQKLYLSTLTLVLLLEITFFTHHLVFHYRTESWPAWQYGYKEAIRALPNDKIQFISLQREPALIRYLFWKQIDPGWFQKNFAIDHVNPNIYPGFDGFKLGDNIYFGNLQAGVGLDKFLPSGSVFLAVQGKDIPGNNIYGGKASDSPRSLDIVKTPITNDPLLQVVEK